MNQILPGLWEIDEIGDRVHCYLWEWSGGLTLIDTGFPGDVHTILDTLTAKGHALHNVRRIIITHGDADHTGGVAKLKRATGAVVGCHSVEKVLLEHPGKRVPAALWLRPLFALVRLTPLFNVLPVTPDELYVDGQTTPEGFIVVHTPGHTPGHISLLHREKRVLIAGDALNNRGGKLQLPPPIFTPDMTNAQRSVWKLAKKYGEDFDVMVFGHGPPILQNGARKVQSLVTQIFPSSV
jgi:glyoxylase-like metal-dependent hydrolase (beta-lactamase superfamily II)